MPQDQGQAASARGTTKSRKSGKSEEGAITRGKNMSSKARKVPGTGMGRG